ncbi:DUF397 domain-containing protein [Streptomyces sp. NPDC015125]|uniref:DUF397 domain-containing protein n=1 Tax=Streptomyces sp. NPDC015125 TaxID=3364938 RepID=UPI0036F52F8F
MGHHHAHIRQGDSSLKEERKWHKSSYSGQNGGDCIECAIPSEAVVLVRDSKDARGPRLTFPAQEWSNFVNAAVEGSFTPVT